MNDAREVQPVLHEDGTIEPQPRANVGDDLRARVLSGDDLGRIAGHEPQQDEDDGADQQERGNELEKPPDDEMRHDYS